MSVKDSVKIQIQKKSKDSVETKFNQEEQLVDISFKDLSYNITTKNTKKEGTIILIIRFGLKYIQRTILNKITGICPGGQMTAILGASGAGKTSLLNILAQRIVKMKGYKITGTLNANGKPYDSKKFSKFAAYIMQDDILFETFTPREALQFVADLKIQDKEEKKIRVNKIIHILRLERCQHTIIGGYYVKGISGGERKRTSIGVELVQDHQVILLDEPTSGLDSFTAFQIINLLKGFCLKQQKTIIFTIHQPSADIYQLFDRIMLLVEGQMIYQGSKQQVLQYFEEMGFKCPMFTNPMDYLLGIMHPSNTVNVKNYGMYFLNYQKRLVPLVNQEIDQTHTYIIQSRSVQTRMLYQIAKICSRAYINVKRDTMLVKGRLYQALFMGLFLGGIYFGVGSNPTDNGQSISGVLFFLSIQHFMSSVMPVIIQFPAERSVFLREENSGLYSALAYFLGKSSVEIPILFALPIIQQLISYWMIKLNDTRAYIVVTHLLIYCVLSLCGNSVGLMAGCIFKDIKVAVGVVPLFIMPLVLFSGFFKNTKNFMSWISWVQYLSPLKYSFEAAMRNNYIDVHLDPDPIEQFGFNIGLWNSVYILIGLIIGLRMIAYFFLVSLKSKMQ